MGCCSSREAVSGDHLPRARRDSAASVAESTKPAGGPASPNRRPNAALRKPKAWRSTSRTWSRRQLDRERKIFWETQVTGQREVWSALQLAVNMVRNENDFKGAKAVLDAIGCTCPTGRLAEGVWDERGVLYKLPKWVVSDPVNVAEPSADEQGPGMMSLVTEDDDEEDEDENDEDETEAKDEAMTDENQPKNEKGKARLPIGPDTLTVKARLSDRATDVELVVDTETPVKAILKRIHTEAGIPPKTRLKIAYLGKMLRDNDTLTLL